MNSRLYTIAEYTDFVGRNLRFIAAGTTTVVLVMAIISLMLPKVYSSSAVINAGTLGVRRGVDIDTFRNRFNGGEYRAALAQFPPGRVTQVWMAFDSPNVFLRVDALDGPTAAAAATHLVDHLIAELARIPVFRPDDTMSPPASAVDTMAIRALLQALDERAAAELDGAQAEQSRLAAERDRILARLRPRDSDDVPAQTKQWDVLADHLSDLFVTSDRAQQQIMHLWIARARLEDMLAIPVSRAAVPGMRKILEVRPPSVEPLVATVDELQAVFASTIRELPPVVPLKVVAAPEVPTSPTRPKPALNLMIGALFGLVGSGFAALLREHEAKE